MTKGLVLWNDFMPMLLDELRSMPQGKIDYFWSTASARTNCYLSPDQGILPKIAARLGMVFSTEIMRFDGQFRYKEPGFPLIFVEVENNPSSIADSELEKLCYVRAPLKLVITVCRWPNSALKTRGLKDIADCAEQWLLESSEVVYGFVIGEAKWVEAERRPGLFYHSFAADANGIVIEERPSEFVGWFSEPVPPARAEAV
jgi:hypothetical protein